MQEMVCKYLGLKLFSYYTKNASSVYDQLDAQFFYFTIRLLQSFTCFE